MNKYLFAFVATSAVAAFAATGTYKVDILDDTTVEGKAVKAGNYKIQVDDKSAVLKRGKESIEVPAHTEQAPSKFSGTRIQYVNNAIQEIHVGGTNLKIVFDTGGVPVTGGTN